MLITAAIVPGPPALVAELMGSAAAELDELRLAADQAVSRAVSDLATAWAASPGSGLGAGSASPQIVVVGRGEPAEFDAAGPVSFASFGRDVVVPAMIDGQRSEPELPTPIMVARYLASRDLAAHPEHAGLWASARWLTTSGAAAFALGRRLAVGGISVALILVADGAACHGPKAPRAQDERADRYDEGVCAALASGRAARLAQIDVELGDELGASGSQVWPVLVAAAAGDGIGKVHWSGAPYGVGWAVASWRPITSSGVVTSS
ncbi:MAG: hypothetical protein ABI903_15280 [Actinomycetota bacterium]